MKQLYSLTLLLCANVCWVQAQTYTPIAVTGFNSDVIAETGTNAAAVTSHVLDLSNYVLFSAAFGAANNLGGGVPNNGYVLAGPRAYKLQGYDVNNVLYLSAGAVTPGTAASGIMAVTTPAAYSKISLLVFSTEGNSVLSVSLKYTDGTIVNTGTHPVFDWFWGTNAISSGYGRVTRLTAGPYVPDGLVDPNPRFYPIDITMPCGNQTKLLESVTVSFVSGNGANVRAVVLAISGVAYAPLTVTPVVTPATCGAADGAVQLNVAGSASPFTYSWNTTPVQTTAKATGLADGNYTCTITDANSCVTTYQATVTKTSALTLSVTPAVPAVCVGDPITLSVAANGGTATTYTWQPGNVTGSNITVTPTTNTSYTVSATDAFGCSASSTVQVAVKPVPIASFTATPDPVCANTEQTIRFTGTAGSNATYNWNGFGGALVKNGSGAGPYTIQFAQTGTYNIQLQVTENGCTSVPDKKDVIVTGPLPAPVITLTTVTATTLTFTWLPVPGATAYQVVANGTPYGNPVTNTEFTITGLQPLQTAGIEVIAMGPVSCLNSAIAKSAGKTTSDQLFIPNSFTPNGDGRNDVFKVYGGIIAGMNMRIFNQWGQLIAESNNVSSGWDGTHRGKKQPMGVYTYVIKLTLTDGSELVRKGFINLLN